MIKVIIKLILLWFAVINFLFDTMLDKPALYRILLTAILISYFLRTLILGYVLII